jgi:DNA-binding LacI/PurR family transcriptional regulator
MPGVVIGPPHLDLDLSYVATDNYDSGRQIVRHLVSRGRKHIIFVQPYPLSGDFWERERGYQAEMAAAGLPLNTHQLTYPVTDDAIDSFLWRRPDALITPDDNHALHFLNRAKFHGLRIPEDIALVGFDDEDFAAETNPSITTVRQPVAEIATRATTYLLDRLMGVERGQYHDILPNTLIVRDST